MLFVDHSLTLQGNRTPTQARCGFSSDFQYDYGYCIDAPGFLPAGSTLRFDPAPHDYLIQPFAASSIAAR
ncbi:hypothetical protein QZN17_05090 [Burkholderia multivorans]|nr:hypothetical protein [Burkholderia multivorans]